MVREKLILTVISIIVLLVFIESLFISGKSNNIDTNLDSHFKINLDKNGILNTENFFNGAPFTVNSWGKDIFYNRKNIYDDWFQLTGVTEFENGYKAIVNGEILSEMDKLKGFIVQDISENKVVLKKNQYRVTLKLEE